MHRKSLFDLVIVKCGDCPDRVPGDAPETGRCIPSYRSTCESMASPENAILARNLYSGPDSPSVTISEAAASGRISFNVRLGIPGITLATFGDMEAALACARSRPSADWVEVHASLAEWAGCADALIYYRNVPQGEAEPVEAFYP